MRRITLYRPGEKDVILVTNLCDADGVPAVDLLTVYLNRWGIERMFQQVTEVFGLEHLIGTRPEGVIFQFAMCLLLYNLIQVVRGVIAVESERQREEISGEKLFQDVQRQMIAWSETVDAGRDGRTLPGGLDGGAGEGAAERIARAGCGRIGG